MAGRVLVIGATGTVGFYRLVRQGFCAPVSPDVRTVLGRPPISFAQLPGTTLPAGRNQFAHAGRAGKSLIIANRASAR